MQMFVLVLADINGETGVSGYTKIWQSHSKQGQQQLLDATVFYEHVFSPLTACYRSHIEEHYF